MASAGGPGRVPIPARLDTMPRSCLSFSRGDWLSKQSGVVDMGFLVRDYVGAGRACMDPLISKSW